MIFLDFSLKAMTWIAVQLRYIHFQRENHTDISTNVSFVMLPFVPQVVVPVVYMFFNLLFTCSVAHFSTCAITCGLSVLLPVALLVVLSVLLPVIYK